MRKLAVFCGSSLGNDAAFAQGAVALGTEMARRGIGLVYGGGNIGLMGKVATAVLEAGGHVTGVIPTFLMEKEIGKIDIQDLRIVSTMHERKALMAELSEGFIALPGGFGTMEEMCEILTWGQLGLHAKPFGMFNINGFYDHFVAFLDHAVAAGLLKVKHRKLAIPGDEAASLLDAMAAWKPVVEEKWITPEKT